MSGRPLEISDRAIRRLGFEVESQALRRVALSPCHVGNEVPAMAGEHPLFDARCRENQQQRQQQDCQPEPMFAVHLGPHVKKVGGSRCLGKA